MRLERLLVSLEKEAQQEPEKADNAESAKIDSTELPEAGGTLAANDDENDDTGISDRVLQAGASIMELRCRQCIRRWRAAVARSARRARAYRIGERYLYECNREAAAATLRHWRNALAQKLASRRRMELGEAQWMTFHARRVVHRLRKRAAQRIRLRNGLARLTQRSHTRCKRSTMLGWLASAQTQRQRRAELEEKVERFQARTDLALARQTFLRWVDWHSHRLVRRVAFERARAHHARVVLSVAFHQWVLFQQVQHEYRAKLKLAVAQHQRAVKCRCLNAWVRWVNHRYLKRQRVAKAREWHRGKVLSSSFRTWRRWMSLGKQEQWRKRAALRFVCF